MSMPSLSDSVEFAENPEPRCPLVLLVDTSGSMGGSPIAELNAGLTVLQAELRADSLAARRVEIALVGFGASVSLLCEFKTADEFVPPSLVADGNTPLGEAVGLALDMIDARKVQYKAAGISYFRPWAMLLTDGVPTDDWQSAAVRVRDMENRKQVAFFPIAVSGADMTVLTAIAHPSRPPMPLAGLRFRELFVWLSRSLTSVSHSNPGDQVALPPTSGWRVV